MFSRTSSLRHLAVMRLSRSVHRTFSLGPQTLYHIAFSSVMYRRFSSAHGRNIFKDERDAEWELLQTGDPLEDDDNAHLRDWELAVKRTCDIIDEVTDKQPHKTLHIYCQPDFVNALGKRNIFSIGGCTDSVEMYEATKDMKQYQDTVQMVDFSKELPYRHHSHQLIVCLCPPDRGDIIPMSEISRILNYDGYAIVGATGKMWKDKSLFPQLEALSQHLEILSIQTTDFNDIECLYYMALLRAQ